MRAVDFHVHLPTAEWIEGSIGPYRETTEAYFRQKVELQSVEDLALEYERLDLFGVALGWDAETATGQPPLDNDEMARVQQDFPDRFVSFAGIDPHKSDAKEELQRCLTSLGMKGLKFHPSLQNFDPSNEVFFPLWEKADELGAVCIFHTGPPAWGLEFRAGRGYVLTLPGQYCSILLRPHFQT